MNRILQYDQIDFAPTKITHRDDDALGSITIFHDIVIAREIIHQYEDGWAYKPAQELENAAWTAEGRWVMIGSHPETGIMSSRSDISGRTVNVRFTKSLTDPKTERPNNRGILADLEVFDSRVDQTMLMEMKSGTRRDVSIGFFFDQDAVPGTIKDEKHPLNGTAYDYVQRNIMIDHTAAALDTGSGRCAFPACGIGADAFKSLVTGDPVGHWETFGECVAAIMKKNPDYTKEQAEGTCGKIEAKSKDFKSTEEDNSNMSNALEEVRTKLQAVLDQIPSLEPAQDDLVEEEYQGNAENMTESTRAQMHFTISKEDWEALSEDEKNDYISRLPPKKTRAGGEELSDRDSDEDCEDCDEEEEDEESEEDVEEQAEEDAEIELPSTDQHIKDTEKILADLDRLVG
jgi:hypothetical protein